MIEIFRARVAGCGAAAWLALAGPACLTAPPAKVPQAPGKAVDVEEGAQVVWSGRGPGELYRVGEVRVFEMRQGEELLGYSWGRYVGTDPMHGDHHVFETRIELRVPGRPVLRSSGRLVLDDAGLVVSGNERSDAAELRFERRGDDLHFTDGSRVDEVAYDPEVRDTAIMAHSALLHEEIMFGLRELALGEEKWRLVSLSGGPPAQWEGQVYADANGIRIVTNLGEQVQLREGRIVRIDVEASDLLIAAVEDVVWPEWTVRGPRKLDYAPPPGAAFTRNEVELPGKPGEPVLYGEVLVPTRGKRPFAGVLFVSGTGQEDRHGFAGPPSVDLGSHEITDALANAGFMVMRFDERGRGKSEAGEISFLGQVEDARRALRTLLVQDGLDPDRIVVVGHGEGGVRALHVAIAQPSAVLGVALLAAPGRAYREVFLHQAEVTLEGLPPEVRSEARVQQKRMLEALERGEAPPELEPQAQWMREMLRQKPGDLIASVDAPLWIAQGGKDFEVDPQADVAALVRAAKQAKKEHEVHRYAELDHLFKLEPETSSPSRYLETDRRVDVGFIADLTAWAKKVVAQR